MPAAPRDQQAPRPQEVFISYSRKDKEFVRRLDEALKRRDREAWVDWEGIPPGDTWEKTIYGAIEGTNTFIFVLTPDSIASEVCGKEIAHAAANNKRLVPIVHRDVVADRVPKSLGELNWIFYRESDDFEAATDTLIRALDTDLKWVRAHTRLLTRAIEWDANGRNNSFVLRGEDLRTAERWLAEAGAQKERQPTALQTEYIIASRKAAARRQRIISGAVTLALIVSLVLTVVAFTQRQQAVGQRKLADERRIEAERQTRIATARRLAIESRGEPPQKFVLPVLLAVEACRADQNRDALGSLWLALRRTPLLHASFSGHQAKVACVAMNPAGNRVASGGGDNLIKVWDVQTGVVLNTLKDHAGSVLTVAWSPDGKQIVSGSYDRSIKLWDGQSGTLIRTFTGHEAPVLSIAWSPDGQRIASGSYDHFIKVWNAKSGALERSLDAHEDAVSAIAWSPDGATLASGGADFRLKFWDAASWTLKRSLENKPNSPGSSWAAVTGLSWNRDGNSLATANDDNTVRLWNSRTGALIRTLGTVAETQNNDEKRAKTVFAVSWHPDGKRIISAGGEQTIKVWDSESGALIQTLSGHEGSIFSVAVSAQGDWVVSAGADKMVKVWNLKADPLVRTLRGHKGVISNVAWNPDGKSVVTGSEDGTIRVWNSESGTVSRTLSDNQEGSDGIRVAWSPDGKTIASACFDAAVKLWDPENPQPPQRLEGHLKVPWSLAFSPSGRMIASASADRTIKLWEVEGRRLVRTFAGHEGPVACAAWSPDETMLASASADGTVRIWNVQSGAQTRVLTPDSSGQQNVIYSVAWSPDGKSLASGSDDHVVRIWDANTG
ncbi:MAG TPA: TIR domain-containing protein, partial [Candidatus Udaeobacter sp.]|nr:TIR domain-containing protein [Candidatus Udaeobacter sp.]